MTRKEARIKLILGGRFFFDKGRLAIWAPTADFQTFNGHPVYETGHIYSQLHMYTVTVLGVT